MSNNIEHIFYINLEKRLDRKEHIEKQLSEYELPFERFNAIPENLGILGTTKSHREVYKLAKERCYKNVLIFEDDFTFLVSKKELEEELAKFFDSNIDYDVCMLAYNVMNHEEVKGLDFIRRIIFSQSASGYIVNERYYDTLISLYDWAIPLLEKTNAHWLYANDQCWRDLQKKDKWYYFTKRIGKQMDGYSDNAKNFVIYNC